MSIFNFILTPRQTNLDILKRVHKINNILLYKSLIKFKMVMGVYYWIMGTCNSNNTAPSIGTIAGRPAGE